MASSYDPIFEEAGRAWNVDPDLLRAVAKGESGAQGSAATSPKGAAGIMQLMPDTARGLGVTDVRDPAQNIFAGAKYLSSHLDTTGGDVPLSLRMYQGGPNQAIWGRENAAYPDYIMSRYQPSQRQDAGPAQPVAASGRDGVINAAVDRARQGTTRATPSVGHDAPDDVLLDSLTGGARTAPAPSGQTAPDMSDDALLGRLTAGTTPASAPTPQPAAPQVASAAPQPANAAFPAPTLDTPEPAASSPSQDAMVRNALAGAKQGISDVGGTVAKGLDRAAMYVNDRVPALAALDRSTGMDPAGNLAAIDRDRAAYDQQYGTSTAAGIGRMGGQLVATAPLMGGVNLAAGAVGNRLLGQGVGNFLTGQAGTGIMRAPSLAAQGALMGATGAAATGDDVQTGAAAGAVAGPLMAGAAGMVRGGVNLLAGRGGSSISPDVAALADLAQTKYGIPIRADQLSQTGSIKMAGDVVNRLPLSGGSAFNAEQLGAFNKALVKTIGATGDALTPSVMMANKQRLGAIFDRVEASTAVPVTNNTAFIGALGKIENDAASVMPGSASDAIRNQVGDILDKAVEHGGTIPGDAFAAFTKKGSRLDVLTNSQDSATKLYASKIKSALQDALEQSLPPGSPLLAEYQTTRAQYAKMKDLEKLAAKAPMGEVNPALVMGRALQSDPQMAYSGGGDLGDLARIGQQFLKAPANSGTPERNSTLNLLSRAGQIGAAGIGLGGAAYAGAALPAAAALGGSLMAGRAAGAALRSPALVNRLIQGSINPLPSFGGALSPEMQPYLAGAGALAFPPQRNVP